MIVKETGLWNSKHIFELSEEEKKSINNILLQLKKNLDANSVQFIPTNTTIASKTDYIIKISFANRITDNFISCCNKLKSIFNAKSVGMYEEQRYASGKVDYIIKLYDSDTIGHIY